MKFIRNISLVMSALVLALSSCNDDTDKISNELIVDKAEVLFAAEGGDEVVLISSSSQWVATSSQPWLKLSPASGIGVTDCEVTVDPSLLHDVRNANIRITNEQGFVKTITVDQFGFDKAILIDEPSVKIENYNKADKRYFETTITTNVLFSVQLPADCDWIKFDNSQLENVEIKHARPQSIKVRFEWSMNTEPEIRTANLKLLPLDNSVSLAQEAVITVEQDAAPLITDSRAGDSLAIIIAGNKLNTYSDFEVTESLSNWAQVTVWERGDKEATPEMMGRVRSVRFYMINTTEGLPEEISKLKYLESFSVFSNENAYIKSIHLGDALNNLEYLKHVELFAYGIVDLPEGFANLKKLETLSLISNSFSSIPQIISRENFPNLTALSLSGGRRRDYINNLSTDKTDDMGLYMNIDHIYTDRQKFIELLSWEELEVLRLSSNYIEGTLPDMNDYPIKYTEADIVASNDSLPRILIGTPKILPKAQYLSLNRNMFTGDIPTWILNHPNLWMWDPFTLIYTQDGFNTDGKRARFDNEPINMEYYYDLYPFRRPIITD